VLSARRLLAFTALLWAVLLANPVGRANLLIQALSRGSALTANEDSFPAPLGLGVYHDFTFSGDPTVLWAPFPARPEDALGLSEADDSDGTAVDLYAAMKRWPRNAAMIALQLDYAQQDIQLGRDDDRVQNPAWPAPNPIPHIPMEPASPKGQWSQYLDLANRGSALEPDNAYFDWMKIMALLALHRDSEAVTLLNRASSKTIYNDHFSERIMDQVAAYQRKRPLTPAEQELVYSQTLPPFAGQLVNAANCLTGRVMELRMQGRNQLAVTTAASLMHLCRLVRDNSYSVSNSFLFLQCESNAFNAVYVPTPGTQGLRTCDFDPSKLLADPSNLAGYALSQHQPEVAKSALSGYLDLKLWYGSSAGLPFEYREQPWAVTAAVQERWGRVLLHTLPGCALLFLLACALTRAWPVTDPSAAGPAWRGGAAALAILIVLFAGDSGLAWRGGESVANMFTADDLIGAPALAAVAPTLVWGVAATALVLLSFASAHRWQRRNRAQPRWLARPKETLRTYHGLADLDPRPLVHFTARATLWLMLLGLYATITLPSGPDARPNWLVSHNNVMAAGIALALVLGAVRAWSVLPDRRQALRLVFLNLRRFSGAYLATALLLYAVSGLAMLPVIHEFDVIHHELLEKGEGGLTRAALGLK